jgi:Winged helix-turn helix
MPAYFFRGEPGAAELRRLARRESGRVCQRVLLIANLLEGMEHEEAARLAGLSRSAAYEWHNRYEEDGIEGLRDRPAHIAVRHHREPCSRQSRDSAPRDTLLGQAPNPRRRWVRSWRGSLPLRTRIKRLCLSPAAEVELGEDVPGHAHPSSGSPQKSGRSSATRRSRDG